MVNDIVNGISVKLNSTFGDGYKVHDINVEQGLKRPCFFIKLLTSINTSLMGKRKKREYPFDVHYFPNDETDNVEMMAMGDNLMEALEYITLLNGDIVRGFDMTYEIIDGVLHFNVTYKVILNDIRRDDAMDEYGIDVKVRG